MDNKRRKKWLIKKILFVKEQAENAVFIKVSLLTNTDIDNKIDNKMVNRWWRTSDAAE